MADRKRRRMDPPIRWVSGVTGRSFAARLAVALLASVSILAVTPAAGAGVLRQARPAAAAPARNTAPWPLVVLDPGHNGGDASHPGEIDKLVYAGYGRWKPCNTTGTSTNSGYSEHAFTWDVAKRVHVMLHAHHVIVRMTRYSDWGVGPCVNTRAAIESGKGVAAAIAIHADGAPSRGHGFHVCEDSRRPEHASWATVRASTALSTDLHNALAAGSGFVPSTYVGHHGYFLRDDLAGLNRSTKPTTFLEIGNMRNAGDAHKQRSSYWRWRIAKAITAGILAYLAHR